VDALAGGGSGVARVEGRVWMIPGTFPGDLVDVAPRKVHARWIEGGAARVVEPSPLRREPPCLIQARCGGCSWMPLAESAQREWKRRVVVDALERIARIGAPQVAETIASPLDLHYRNKVELTLGLGADDEPILGFHAAHSSGTLVDVERCLVQSEAADRVLVVLRELLATRFLDEARRWVRTAAEPIRVVLRTSSATGTVLVALRSVANLTGARGLAQALAEACAHVAAVVALFALPERRGGVRAEALVGEAWLPERIAGLRFRLPAASFLQVNPGAAERLIETVAQASGVPRGARVLELYGGVGLFSLVLAQRGASAMVCEADAAAVECGQAAARANGNLLVRYERAETGAFLERFARSSMRKPDVVVADPPRSGLGKGIADRIANLHPRRIVLVSCDPATLARDAGALRVRGYRLDHAIPIDLFPQTPHVEAVAVFGREA